MHEKAGRQGASTKLSLSRACLSLMLFLAFAFCLSSLYISLSYFSSILKRKEENIVSLQKRKAACLPHPLERKGGRTENIL